MALHPAWRGITEHATGEYPEYPGMVFSRRQDVYLAFTLNEYSGNSIIVFTTTYGTIKPPGRFPPSLNPHRPKAYTVVHRSDRRPTFPP